MHFSLSFSVFSPSFPNTDGFVFRLHYKFTCAILVAFCIFIGCKQYIGNPIECQYSGNRILDPNKLAIIKSWCWSRGTFSVTKSWNKTVGVNVPYPGVDKLLAGDDATYHAYYKWVPVVLLLQAILFYLPRYFWNSNEGGRAKYLVQDLNCPMLSEDTGRASRKSLVRYFVTHLHKHEWYFQYFVFAEFLNFVNVVGQLFLMDKFLGKKFLTYGPAAIQFRGNKYTDGYHPMTQLFPILTKCSYYTHDSSGQIEKEDIICLLPINAYNEKLYVFLWFWFVLLSILSGLVVMFHMLTVIPCVRLYVIKARDISVNKFDLQSVLRWFSLGDWFLLNILSKNMDCVNFQEFLTDLAVTLEEKLVKNRWINTHPNPENISSYNTAHLVINEHYVTGPIEGYETSEL